MNSTNTAMDTTVKAVKKSDKMVGDIDLKKLHKTLRCHMTYNTKIATVKTLGELVALKHIFSDKLIDDTAYAVEKYSPILDILNSIFDYITPTLKHLQIYAAYNLDSDYILSKMNITTAVFEYICEHDWVDIIETYLKKGVQATINCANSIARKHSDKLMNMIIDTNVIPAIETLEFAFGNSAISLKTCVTIMTRYSIHPNDTCLELCCAYRSVNEIEFLLNNGLKPTAKCLQYILNNTTLDAHFNSTDTSSGSVSAPTNRKATKGFKKVAANNKGSKNRHIDAKLAMIAKYGFTVDKNCLLLLMDQITMTSTYNIPIDMDILECACKTQPTAYIKKLIDESKLVPSETCLQLLMINQHNITDSLLLLLSAGYVLTDSDIELLINHHVTITKLPQIKLDANILRYCCKKRRIDDINEIINQGITPDIDCLEQLCERDEEHSCHLGYRSDLITLIKSIIIDHKIAPTTKCLENILKFNGLDVNIIKLLITNGASVDMNCIRAYCENNGDKVLKVLLNNF
ncbi:MAG: hypothetical protein Faunusvirus9_14 [Faunusvirus sp.]|jgi:hypothetical protein|uniref:Ankyrin repeat protein n=1 Tax=Faunusvirus sp. TaxID=2487766 RepID=A0A3G4ZWP9_9VIRU|nr:MAG: hypothetical protein Faunusvirus9_14 [Faunusvirus sp.]